MGYALMHGMCGGCRRFFSFNPVRVPSVRWKGKREPLCEDCAAVVNRNRVRDGLEPQPIAKDAYAAVDEGELR